MWKTSQLISVAVLAAFVAGREASLYAAAVVSYTGTYTTLDDPLASAGGTAATGISGSTIIGYYYTVDSTIDNPAHGFIYNGSSWTTLDDTDPVPAGSAAPNVINPSGTGTFPIGISGNTIVGYYYPNGDSTIPHGFIYNGSSFTVLDDPLATLGTQPRGISGNTIVGNYNDDSGYHGFIYNGSSFTTIDDPLAILGRTAITGISGNIVSGFYANSSGYHGFSYNGVAFTTIDYPNGLGGGTVLWGVSGANFAGDFYDSGNSTHAILSKGSYFVPIVNPANYSQALGVDGTNVVGFYVTPGHQHGFVALNVPEPSAAVMVGTAVLCVLAGVANRVRRRGFWQSTANPTTRRPTTDGIQ